MKNIRNHRISSAIAIFLGGFYFLVDLFFLATQYKPEHFDNTMLGLCLGVGYLGFGLILRYTSERRTILVSLLSLIILTLAILVPTVFQPGGIVIGVFTPIPLILLFLLSAELGFLKNQLK
jgi:hypothetical protein